MEKNEEKKYLKDSELLKALAHPVRLKILEGLLESDGCNVNEIVEKLNTPQPTISQHLKTLKINGILSSRKEGVKICYKVSDKRIAKIIKILQ